MAAIAWLDLDRRRCPGDPWPKIVETIADAAALRGVELRDSIVLLPFVQLLPCAIRAFAQRGGWMPRVETTATLARAQASHAPTEPQGLTFDTATDALNALAMLRRQAWGQSWERRDPAAFAQAASHLTQTAHAFASCAHALRPDARLAYWARVREALGPVDGVGARDRALACIALEWAAVSASPATDALFSVEPAAWFAVSAGGRDALTLNVLDAAPAHTACIVIDLDVGGSSMGLAPDPEPVLAICDDFEDEAQSAAAQVLCHLSAGCRPVALVAQDRILVRRVRALLERGSISIRDETGWKLSTTRAAARVVTLLRAAQPGASTDGLLDWIKTGAEWQGIDDVAAATASLEASCRQASLSRIAALPGAALGPDSRRLVRLAIACLERLAGGGAQTLKSWLGALSTALAECGALAALSEDDAGRQVIAKLGLTDSASPGEHSVWAAAGQVVLALGEFTRWVDSALESGSFVPASVRAELADVIIAPLAQTMLRPLGAIVFPGTDATRLGAANLMHPLLSDAQAVALGLEGVQQRREAERLRMAQLWWCGASLTLLRRRQDDAQLLSNSPLVEQWAASLKAQGRCFAQWMDPRTEQVLERHRIERYGPSVVAMLPQRLSASSFEALRECPYRFFAKVVLLLRVPDELERDLEKRDYGNWLHVVLHRFHTHRTEAVVPAIELDRLMSTAQACQRETGLDDNEFLPYAASFKALAPRYIEWLHERERAGQCWAHGELEVIRAPEDLQGVELLGKIDRIDTIGSGASFAVGVDRLQDRQCSGAERQSARAVRRHAAGVLRCPAAGEHVDPAARVLSCARQPQGRRGDRASRCCRVGACTDRRHGVGACPAARRRAPAPAGRGGRLRILRSARPVPARPLGKPNDFAHMSGPAYRADGQPVSREQFYRLACDPGRSCVVEACAGAGKTWILVSRILRALLEGARPQEVLAITFTRKAASEMQQRLNEWLLEFSDPTLTPAERAEVLVARGLAPSAATRLAPELAQLHSRLLNEVRGVQVQTFHAWFAQLLRSAPSELLDELGLQRDVELIETIDEHRAAVWRRFHAAVREDADCRADFEALCARRGRARLREWLEAALERRIEIERADQAGTLETSVASAAQVWPELDPGQHPGQTLNAPIWRLSLRGLAIELARGGARAQAAAQRLIQAMEQADAVQYFTSAWEVLFTDTGRRELGRVAGLPEVQARLERLAEQIQQHEAQLEHLAMVRLSRVLLVQYAAYKRAQGLADMADLEGCALALLRDGTLAGWVQERLDARYRHVLIDEFQDTSPLQWQALHAWLMGYAGAGGGASGQRPPSIFIVGDPKQSIYRFRRAEPRVFEAVRAFVRDALEGVILECDHTRRNAPQIIEPLNEVFLRASELGEFGAYRRHSSEVQGAQSAGIRVLPSVPRPGAARGGTKPDDGATKVWRDSLITPRHSVDEVLREEEARRVASAVAELVRSEAIAAHEVMVLCRKRQSLRLAATALRALHIPFVAVEDHALLDAPEARDLVAVLDVLASPEHDLSLAQALRSPLFGASDEDLMTLARQRDARGSWWAALMQAPQNPQAPDASPALQRARELLQRWRGDATRLPPHDLLERIVHQGEYRERVAQCVAPDQCRAALDSIDALLAQALTLDGARYSTPYNFVRALKRRSVRVISPARSDAVQLLTVHGAKGLEARVVFVMDAQPEAATSRPPGVLVDWPVHAQTPLRCAFVYSETRCPTSLRELLQTEREARLREELNGLYVALTRAKERLVLSATQPHRGEPGLSWWDRMAPHAAPWEPDKPANAEIGRAIALDATVRLKVLPRWERGPDIAPDQPRSGEDTEGDSSAMQCLGRAVHRFLEWAAPGLRSTAVQDRPQLADRAAREFGANEEQVLAIGSTILSSPESASFFDRTALRWSGNEVPVSLHGDVLRIDRLCQFDAAHGGAWWVLDYKLMHRPEQLEPYRNQLLSYREAVACLEPGATVRCAFLTGQGRLIEIG